MQQNNNVLDSRQFGKIRQRKRRITKYGAPVIYDYNNSLYTFQFKTNVVLRGFKGILRDVKAK